MSQQKTADEYRAEARALEQKAEAVEAAANSADNCGCEIAKAAVSTAVRVGVLAAVGVPLSI